MQWHATSNSTLPSLTIRQVYCWIFDAKNRIVVVSKDGTNWQLPGGKPEKFMAMEKVLVDLATTAFGSTVIDTSRLTVDEVCDNVMTGVYGNEPR
jgi:hypothetical protein